MADVLVVGQLARDLVLQVDEMPGPQGSVAVRGRREMLGGKGANQAVALTQLGRTAGLIAVVGDDAAGGWLVRQARQDDIDVGSVVERPGTPSGLIVDIVTPDGRWRYLEDLPEPVLLTGSDVAAAADRLPGARAMLVQLQQPSEAAWMAADLARTAGLLVVLDGAPAQDDRQQDILAAADVLRADAREAPALSGASVDTVDDALRAGRELLRRGPRFVAFAAGEIGNVFVWADGHLCLPLVADEVVDTTGAGDAFTAALTVAMLAGESPAAAARYASAAAAATVGHPGGRPALSADALRPYLARLQQTAG